MICGNIRPSVAVWNFDPVDPSDSLFLKGKTMATKASAPKKDATKATKTGAVGAKVQNVKPVKAAPAAKSAVVKKAPPSKPAQGKAPFDRTTISDEQRYRMIAEAAYFRAESRNFQSDHVRDWIEAERDIALLLGEDQ
jgi:hypothetical protein